jgi:hypothetical protein
MSGQTARFLEFALFFGAAIAWCAWEIWRVRRSMRDDRDRDRRS